MDSGMDPLKSLVSKALFIFNKLKIHIINIIYL